MPVANENPCPQSGSVTVPPLSYRSANQPVSAATGPPVRPVPIRRARRPDPLGDSGAFSTKPPVGHPTGAILGCKLSCHRRHLEILKHGGSCCGTRTRNGSHATGSQSRSGDERLTAGLSRALGLAHRSGAGCLDANSGARRQPARTHQAKPHRAFRKTGWRGRSALRRGPATLGV